MAKYVLLQMANGRPLLVDATDQKALSETFRYLDDCGIQFDVNEDLDPMSPGELSDLLAPRDE